MEALLSLSFDYLSSYDASKIRKGLRQVEGLLAQICLSKSQSTAMERRKSTIATGNSPARAKDLGTLKDDPAFREFFKLQEGFEWNGALVNLEANPSIEKRFTLIPSLRHSGHAIDLLSGATTREGKQ